MAARGTSSTSRGGGSDDPRPGSLIPPPAILGARPRRPCPQYWKEANLMARDESENGMAAVARLAGVSNATVSNALNRPDKVLPATRQKVYDAIKQLDYMPNRAAAALRQGTSRLVGLVVPDIDNPFYSALASAVAKEAARHDYTAALYVTDDDPEVELQSFARLAELRAAGALLVPREAQTDHLRRLESVGTRLVFIDRTEDDALACSVVIDDVTGGRLAVEHLLARHGSRIALVNGPHRISQCADRRHGADLAIERAGHGQLHEYVVDEMTIDAGFEVGLALADGGDLPDGVFCTNDQLAVGVMRGLRERAVSVPDTVGVVGYGDLSLARDGVVQLTTVRQPKEELGRAAVDLILAEIASKGNGHRHTQLVFEPDLVVRESTR
ncbi:LacI family DNA-binding transcriptional regulator [Microbacterium sp. NPDC091313]